MKPKLDYFIGRPFESVEQGDEDWQWVVKLQGNTLIRNLDEERTAAPSGLDGTSLLSVEEPEGEAVMLLFGTAGPDASDVVSQVALTPDKYSISDENFPDEDEPDTTLPDDPSPDRVIDGPTAQRESPLEGSEEPSQARRASKKG